MTRHEPIAVRLLLAFARRVLPREHLDTLFDEQAQTIVDGWRDPVHRGLYGRTRFVTREAAGMVATAAKAWRERRRSPISPRPSRNPNMLQTLFKDIRFAFRMIRKTPIVATIAIVSVALGVSINVSVFSLLNSWLVRPLPYPDADRLVLAYEMDRDDPGDLDGTPPADYFDWQERSTSFEIWTAADFGVANLTGVDRPEQITIADVTPNLLQVIGASPLLGRTFAPDEGGTEDAIVAVIGETLWRTTFGRDPDVIGRTVTIDGQAHNIIGVMPETFDFLLGGVSMWRANDFLGRRDDRIGQSLNVTAKLREGVALSQAQAEMDRIMASLEREHPDANRNRGVNLQTVREQFPGPTDRALILILSTVVLLALLIACANVATLVMAKTEVRQREIAIRTAMGAGRGRILQQLLTESVLLAMIAGVLGILLAAIFIPGLAQGLPDVIPWIYRPHFDRNVLLYGIVISAMAGLAFGITPATQAISGNLRSALGEGGRGGTAGRRKRRLRNAFVVAEFAMAIVILIGASVLTEMFTRSLRIDAGYVSENILTVEFRIPEHRYENDEAVVAFTEDLGREFDQLAGVQTWAFTTQLPRTYSLPSARFTVDGDPVEDGAEPEASTLSISPAYLETLSASLVEGRTFLAADRAEAPPVVLVNQVFVDRFFGGSEPIGRRITVGERSREVVGVVTNMAQTRLAGLAPAAPTVFFPLAQSPARLLRAMFKTSGNPHDIAGAVQSAMWRVDADQPVTAVQTLDEFITVQLAGPDMLSALLYTVGILALTLSAIGIYGVMAFAVSQQTNEIGIRMALGAEPMRVLRRVARQGITLAGIGVLIGTPAAFLVARWILSIPTGIPGVNIEDIGVSYGPILQVSAILITVGLVASFLPARRATRIDPASALREE